VQQIGSVCLTLTLSMRRIFSILMVAIALLSLQGGKYAYYLACRWQATVIWQQKNCDCEKHLSNADDDAAASSTAAQQALKDAPIGLLAVFEYPALHHTSTVFHCLAAYQSFLPTGFRKISERPPACILG
jgi:hypothetical protein